MQSEKSALQLKMESGAVQDEVRRIFDARGDFDRWSDPDGPILPTEQDDITSVCARLQVPVGMFVNEIRDYAAVMKKVDQLDRRDRNRLYRRR